MHAYAADDELRDSRTPDDHDRGGDMGGLDSENPKNELREKKNLWLRGQFLADTTYRVMAIVATMPNKPT